MYKCIIPGDIFVLVSNQAVTDHQNTLDDKHVLLVTELFASENCFKFSYHFDVALHCAAFVV